jgi:hypothetical protein
LRDPGWALEGETFNITLEEEAATVLQLPNEVVFAIPDDEIKLVTDHFPAIIRRNQI